MGCAACTVSFKLAQFIYFAVFLGTVIACWVLRDYGGSALDFSPLNECLSQTDPTNRSCLGQQAVMAISFGTFCFFALQMLLLLGVSHKSNPRLSIHTGWWPIKFLLWAGACAGFFWVPASALDGFSQAARVFSGFFIILQLIILLDFIYVVNEWLLERDQCAWALVASTALLICGAFVGIGFLYHYWAPEPSCSLNIWFITSIILFFLIYGAISISPIRPESAGLFTSACVFAYTTYYCWSALNSEPLSHACANSTASSNKAVQIVGFVVAILALGYSTMSGATSSNAFDLSAGTGCDDDELPHRPDFFHLMFMLASCYMAMLFVGWDLEGQQGQNSMDRGWGSTWTKIIAAWLCCGLYAWTLIAHRVLKNRSF
ncbi:putative serine incorporator [Chlorella sorokiniana]|uniref:Serine incorporator n=1 Tax=Chlorella sorokiniana TaxID=3076 RepID=A0A2P6U0W7_CHLSO|nr:putative serine incorporator [Chlorella sorokiniana]|eukprot:PRW59950.1 putative serine incorporator [Chlorella sorokiniana]